MQKYLLCDLQRYCKGRSRIFLCIAVTPIDSHRDDARMAAKSYSEAYNNLSSEKVPKI